MKNKLNAILSFILSLLMLFSFAACGEEAPAKDDDITPPVEDAPTADEPEEPSEPSDTPDEPTQPDVPVEPDETDTPTDANISYTFSLFSKDPVIIDMDNPDVLATLALYEQVISGDLTPIIVYNEVSEPQSGYKHSYSIIDLNQDGIPEIIMAANYGYHIFYCIDGQVYIDFWFDKTAQSLYLDCITMSGSAYNTYYFIHELTPSGLQPTRIASKELIEDSSSIGGMRFAYYYDGEEISKEMFLAFEEQLLAANQKFYQTVPY